MAVKIHKRNKREKTKSISEIAVSLENKPIYETPEAEKKTIETKEDEKPSYGREFFARIY